MATALRERLTTVFPGAVIAGAYSPPFRPLTRAEDEAVVKMIEDAQADFVWVGLGSPKQDLWIAEHRGRIDAGAFLAVGAAFDFHAGRLERAPAWMRRLGLEWLHRLWSEPRRLVYRYTVVSAEFIALLLAVRLRRLLGRSGPMRTRP